MDIDYNNEVFKKHTYNLKDYPENSIRCNICYSIRLDKTASLAKKYNYKYFTTTLSVSPFKNASIINKIGYNIGKKKGVLYLPADFKKNDGFKKSIELSKYYDLYRQDYCGCLSSKNK
jgi:predicted adenine nucleotide alpha hydrolase (AANH) superfamily ATPase